MNSKKKSIFANVCDLVGTVVSNGEQRSANSSALDLTKQSNKLHSQTLVYPLPLLAPPSLPEMLPNFTKNASGAAFDPSIFTSSPDQQCQATQVVDYGAFLPYITMPNGLQHKYCQNFLNSPNSAIVTLATDSDLMGKARNKMNNRLNKSNGCKKLSGTSRCQLKLPAHPPSSLSLLPSGQKNLSRQPPRFQCADCNRSYSTFSGLSKHQQFHCASQLKRQFGCKFCDKQYSSLGALKMHIRTHTLPCKCHLCGKAFSRPWLLQGHLRTHTGEKPFSCAHCGRAFADRSNLRAHLQTHSDVKKYRCQKCQKTFSRMSLLNKHETNGCSIVYTHPVA